MQHRDITILKKILSEIDVASGFIKDVSLGDFEENEIIKRAVCMTVINIGELVKNLSDDFRESNTGVPWRAIAGFRDIAAHKYQTLRMADVYKTVVDDFPSLKENINQILKSQ